MTKSLDGAMSRLTRLKTSEPSHLAIAFLRLTLGAGFLSAVADRLGFWAPQEPFWSHGATFTIFCSTPPNSIPGAQPHFFYSLE